MKNLKKVAAVLAAAMAMNALALQIWKPLCRTVTLTKMAM